MTKHIMKFAATCLCALPLCVNAGDLTVSNVTLYGKLEFANETAYPASGGTITTNGNYVIHAFTTVGTNSFIVSSGSLTCDVLVVAGGGGGGNTYGGGGGAGGVVYATNISVSGSNNVVVGEAGIGGSGCYTEAARGSDGSNSIFGGITALGGGGGGGHAYGDVTDGNDGGSGGGGSEYSGAGAAGLGLQTDSGGGLGYGNNGGIRTDNPLCAGGGGGAGATGGNGSSSVGGVGGVGLECAISGSNVYYAGGGGGAGTDANGGSGGNGGGGAGGSGNSPPNGNGGDGASNSGGGGGGGVFGPYGTVGGAGGSGIVIVRYLNTSTNVTPSIHGINQNSASATNIFLGKVGIGTNSPAEKLHIDGNVRVDGMVVLTTPPGDFPMGVFTNQ